jgi:hypothetical protein
MPGGDHIYPGFKAVMVDLMGHFAGNVKVQSFLYGLADFVCPASGNHGPGTVLPDPKRINPQGLPAQAIRGFVNP